MADPVSYTHLDVYKRQDMRSPDMGGSTVLVFSMNFHNRAWSGELLPGHRALDEL